MRTAPTGTAVHASALSAQYAFEIVQCKYKRSATAESKARLSIKSILVVLVTLFVSHLECRFIRVS